MLETQRLVLKLLDEQDEENIIKWRNKKDVIDSLFSHQGVTVAQHRIWYERYLKDESRIEFVLVKKNDGIKIGTIGLSSIDYKNQKAEYGILIGEAQERGKGFAKEASIAIIDYAFFELNIQKIKLSVFSDNKNAIQLYQKLGFKEEGILRKEIYKNKRYKDVIAMALFKEDWMK